MLMMRFEAQENWDPMAWQLLYDQQLLLCKLSVATRSSQGQHHGGTVKFLYTSSCHKEPELTR